MSKTLPKTTSGPLIDKLPSACGTYDALPQGLVGSRIVRFATFNPEHHALEGGGLLIDFVPDGSSEVRQVVFELNDNGIWQIDAAEAFQRPCRWMYRQSQSESIGYGHPST